MLRLHTCKLLFQWCMNNSTKKRLQKIKLNLKHAINVQLRNTNHLNVKQIRDCYVRYLLQFSFLYIFIITKLWKKKFYLCTTRDFTTEVRTILLSALLATLVSLISIWIEPIEVIKSSALKAKLVNDFEKHSYLIIFDYKEIS